jgi:hypothetical protein
MVVLAGCGGFLGGGPSGGESPEKIAEEPPDPEQDRIGWEQGVWYNESLDIDQSDGLSESERRKLVARTMARVEKIRQLEFRSQVPVEVISRERFASARGSREVPDAKRTFTNAKFEALFMINESRDAVSVRRQGTTSSVSGFYSPRQGKIFLIAKGGEGVQIEEQTLAHELTHALQNQHFDLDKFERPTREAHNSVDGLVEGDANLVQFLYEQRCADAWNGTCVTGPPRKTEGGAGSLEAIGPYLLQYQPYSDGPAFVKQMRAEGGWEKVNSLYADPPASTEQTIHPELYGEDTPTSVQIEDRSDDEWSRLRVPGRVNYAHVGEAGLASMLVRPTLSTQGQSEVVTAPTFFSDNRSFDPYNYSNRYTSGWDGDRLVVYRSQETAANEHGYVFKTVWDSGADAQEFAEGYRQLLEIQGARPVDGRNDTWRIPDGTSFEDAYYLHVEGDTVTIVNAPSVQALSEIDSRAGEGASGRTDSREPALGGGVSPAVGN